MTVRETHWEFSCMCTKGSRYGSRILCRVWI